MLAFLLLLVSWYRQSGAIAGSDRTFFKNHAYSINLNRAGQAEWTLIPGIGPHLAEKIFGYCKSTGFIDNISDLEQINGLGPVKIASLREWVSVGGITSEENALCPEKKE